MADGYDPVYCSCYKQQVSFALLNDSLDGSALIGMKAARGVLRRTHYDARRGPLQPIRSLPDFKSPGGSND